MRSLIATTLLTLTLAACGSSDDSKNVIVQEVDVKAWKAELVKLDGVGPQPNMGRLEELTRSDCKAPVDELALGFTLAGARPDVTRVNMRFVCPDQAHKVDDALKQGQDASAAVDEACALPESQRTEEQSQLAEAMAC